MFYNEVKIYFELPAQPETVKLQPLKSNRNSGNVVKIWQKFSQPRFIYQHHGIHVKVHKGEPYAVRVEYSPMADDTHRSLSTHPGNCFCKTPKEKHSPPSHDAYCRDTRTLIRVSSRLTIVQSSYSVGVNSLYIALEMHSTVHLVNYCSTSMWVCIVV